MPMEYIVSSLRIAVVTCMDDEGELEECLAQLVQLEEDRFITGFHQHVEKDRQKSWHDRHIKKKNFQKGYMVVMYASKFTKHPGKLQMHWLGLYVINSIIMRDAVHLQQ